MPPAITSWLLSIPYLLTGIGLVFLAWSAGGLAYALLFGRRLHWRQWSMEIAGSGLFLLTVRIAAGLALFSWAGAVLGVAGQFKLWLVLPLLFLLIMTGLLAGHWFAPRHKPALLRDRLAIGGDWLSSPLPERIFGAMILLAFCAIVVNMIVGSLHFDMNQDPMWYHLSVPQQWTFSGRFDAYPNVMQSSFPLAAESLFAIIFLVGGNPVLCSLLSALCGLGVFLAMVSGSYASLASEPDSQWRGWGVGAVVGICVPLLTMYGLMAPVQAKNDIITMYWAACGGLLVWVPLLGARQVPSLGWWATAGFLLGTGFCAKPPVLSVAFFALVFAAALSFRLERRSGSRWPRTTIGGCILCLLAMSAASAPWLIRGYESTGVPLFPVGRSLFEVKPDYLPLVAAQDSIQTVPGFSAGAWVQRILAFGDRLVMAAQHNEKFIFLYMLAAMAGLLAARGRWRFYAIMLLAQLVFIVGVTGAMEMFRLFSPAYCLAGPMIAWLVAEFAPRISRQVRLAAALAIWVSIMGTTATIQFRAANYMTHQWKFRPVLAEDDVREYATHAEKGSTYLEYPAIRPFIEKDQRVLLLGERYPYYLHRDTLWNDEAVGKGGLEDRWSRMNLAEASGFLQEEKIDVVLINSRAGQVRLPLPGPIDELVANGVLDPAELPEDSQAQGWHLYRVKE